MASFVIDASATLPWCFDDEATAYTEGLLNRCAAGEEVVVASVWPLEIPLIPSDFVVHSFRPPMEEAMSRLWSQLG